jgi:exopolysaccharide biosynthesis predicted pyruvyltransferase EpsI
LDKSDYDRIKIEQEYKEDYIYVHNVHITKADDNLYRIAQEISNRLNLPILCNQKENFKNMLKPFIKGGPKDFIGVISKAKFIITNSFHATVFSIIYNKEFITVPHYKFSIRMKNLLEILNLSNRLCASVDELTEQTLQKIDFEKVYDNILKAREQSINFLNNAIYGEHIIDKKLTYLESSNKFTCYGCEACKNVCQIMQ